MGETGCLVRGTKLTLAGWKMGAPDWVDVFPVKNGDVIPAIAMWSFTRGYLLHIFVGGVTLDMFIFWKEVDTLYWISIKLTVKWAQVQPGSWTGNLTGWNSGTSKMWEICLFLDVFFLVFWLCKCHTCILFRVYAGSEFAQRASLTRWEVTL